MSRKLFPPNVSAPSVRGVLFDACNVLYDNTLWRRWLLQLLSRLGLHTNYRCFFRVWDREFLDAVCRGRRTFGEAFRSFLRSAGLSSGQIDEVEAACKFRHRELHADTLPLPGVKATLGRLHKAGVVLGSISNSEYSAAAHRQWLDRFALGECFTSVVSSIDLGQTMPDPACYMKALGEMQLSPAEVAFVGHDALEMSGAAELGMPTIAFNFEPDVQADVYINRFDELIDVVASRPSLTAAG